MEALNTSSQVQQFTLDEYQNKFDELKDAVQKGGFNPSVVAFRENEEKEWDVREIVQRLACFLKERWKTTQPASMYRSKGKALDLYTTNQRTTSFADYTTWQPTCRNLRSRFILECAQANNSV